MGVESFKTNCNYILKSPGKYFRSKEFAWVYLVYGGSYLAVNAMQSVFAAYKSKYKAQISWFCITGSNVFLGIAKDAAFAKYFGTKAASKIPALTYAIWLARDGAAMAFCITLPPIFGTLMADYLHLPERVCYY